MRLRQIDLLRALKRCTNADPVVFICPCGCGNETILARDEKALWFCQGVNDTPTIQSIKSKEELDMLLAALKPLVAPAAFVELRDLATHLFHPN